MNVSYVWFQIGTQNSLELIDDPRAAAVEEIAAKLGLRKVTPVPTLYFCHRNKVLTYSSVSIYSNDISLHRCRFSSVYLLHFPCLRVVDGNYFLTLLGGVDLHRPAVGGYKNRHSALHQKQGKTICLYRQKAAIQLYAFPYILSIYLSIPLVFNAFVCKFKRVMCFLSRTLIF